MEVQLCTPFPYFLRASPYLSVPRLNIVKPTMLVLSVQVRCLCYPGRLWSRSALPMVLARKWQPAPVSLCSVRYLTLECRRLVVPSCRQLPTTNRRNLGSTYEVNVNVTLPRVQAFFECFCLVCTLTVRARLIYLVDDRLNMPCLDPVRTVVVVDLPKLGPETSLYVARNRTALEP